MPSQVSQANNPMMSNDEVGMDLEDIDEEEQGNELPSVELSFSGQRGGAWDDRELVKAYDAALSEFNAHHPGPGSWLDKATAALAKGQSLPGADSNGTAWYSASQSEDLREPEAGPSKVPAKLPKKVALRPVPNEAKPSNPYATALNVSRDPVNGNGRMSSPAFTPPSPSGPSRNTAKHVTDQSDQYDLSFHLAAVQSSVPNHQRVASTPYDGGPGGSTGLIEPTGQVSVAEAMSLAMTAQYWAGYWMGVAQTKVDNTSSAPPQPPISNALQEQRVVQPLLDHDQEYPGHLRADPHHPSNLIVTHQQFGTAPSHLKR